MIKKIIYIISGLILLSCSYIIFQLFAPLPIGSKNIEIQIPKGSTFRQAADIFAKEKILRDKNLFLFLGRITGIDKKIRAGYYSIYSSMDLFDLLKVLRRGQIIEYEITVVEGDSLSEIASKLEEKNIISKEDFKKLSTDKNLLAYFNIDAPSFEGYLFPETYKIPKGMEPTEVIGMMVSKMREKFSESFKQRADEIGLSEREILTLASIIEKEAAVDEERPLISAVYHNRLKKKMPLQADPTSIYGIKSMKEKITYDDLKRRTPYNTYIIRGLPPGPIASPGLKSIKAALYPAKVDYLYFVSNNDRTHIFSKNIDDHLKAVKEYRNKKKLEKEDNEYIESAG